LAKIPIGNTCKVKPNWSEPPGKTRKSFIQLGAGDHCIWVLLCDLLSFLSHRVTQRNDSNLIEWLHEHSAKKKLNSFLDIFIIENLQLRVIFIAQ